MSQTNPLVVQLLARMLEDSQLNVETLVGSVQRVSRELSALAYNYSGHIARAGFRDSTMQALDGQLDEISTILGRTLFDLQQRLLGDVQALRQLDRIHAVIDLEDTRSVGVRVREALDQYCVALAQEYFAISETLGNLSFRVRLLANNIEISACQAGGDAVNSSVDLFCIMAGQLRGLADRLRGTTGDLRIFEQTQKGHAESVRVALASSEEGAAA
ncbi:MAG TPA: hypothetical protein VN837_21480 [Chloroflexota bacterium]|nr:hypothetical protein [Chloroflexota bacterium]